MNPPELFIHKSQRLKPSDTPSAGSVSCVLFVLIFVFFASVGAGQSYLWATKCNIVPLGRVAEGFATVVRWRGRKEPRRQQSALFIWSASFWVLGFPALCHCDEATRMEPTRTAARSFETASCWFRIFRSGSVLTLLFFLSPRVRCGPPVSGTKGELRP